MHELVDLFADEIWELSEERVRIAREETEKFREEAERERHDTMVECLQSVMNSLTMTAEQAMDVLSIPPSDRAFFMESLE